MFASFSNADSIAVIDHRAAQIAPYVIRFAVYTSGFAVVAAAALLVMGLLAG